MKNISIKLIFMFICFIFYVDVYAINFDEESFYTDGKITVSNVVFGDTGDDITFEYYVTALDTNPDLPTNDLNEYTFEMKMNEEYELDFSNIDYNSTGIYKYLIEESHVTENKKYKLSDDKYEISVYVTNRDGIYRPYVFKQIIDMNTEKKMSDLVFEHNSMTYLEINMDVTGINSDSNQYFEVVLKIDANVGDLFSVNGLEKEVVFNGKKYENPSEIVLGEDKTVKIYLKKDQIVTIGDSENNYQIPYGTKVSVKINGADKYKTTINDVVSKKMDSFVLNSESNKIAIINDASYDLPITGINYSILPFIVMISLSLISMLVIKHNKVRI